MKIPRSTALFVVLLAVSVFGQKTEVLQGILPLNQPVSEPAIFAPNVVSTQDYEAAAEFSPDWKSIYFVKSTPDFNYWTVVFSQYQNGRWNEPQVAPFSGRYSDADPFFTADGKRMFFISRRPVKPEISPNAEGKLDIYVMNKTADGWSEPQNLGKIVNSEGSEFFPTLTDDGTLYFGSQRAGGIGGLDLYRSKFVNGAFQTPENLGDAINTQFDEFEGFIAPDESFLIFMASGRPDGIGGMDLFISYNENGKWTKARNLDAPINSPTDELSPKITRDGKYFFWTSNRSAIDKPKAKSWNYRELTGGYRNPQNGLGDIYYIDVRALKLKKRN